jgi:hypothetical protein
MIDLIKKLSDRPIAFHRIYAKISGGITSGLMLSQAMYWSSRTNDSDGWFYKTADEWEEETALSRREQETARMRLRNAGFWEEKLRGVPAKLHFRIDQNKLISSLAESAKLDLPVTPNKNGDIVETIITETTTETTTPEESKDSSQKALFPEQGSQETVNQNLKEKKTLARERNHKPPALPVDLAYPEFVRIWTEAYPELGFDALSGRKIKSLISQTKAILRENNKPDDPEAAKNLFAYILAYMKRSGHWLHGKSITVVDSKYREIYFEIKNGKKQPTAKKQSARDYINSFKQGR